MSRMPRPPRLFGRQTVLQFTNGMPLSEFGLERHRKFLLSLSICLIAQLSNLNAMSRCSGIAERTELTKLRRASGDVSLPLQICNFAAILSRVGWMSARVIFLKCNGKPRYLQGKLLSGTGKFRSRELRSMSSQAMGRNMLLCTLALRPEADPNRH